MAEPRTTVMILMPGRKALSFVIPRAPWKALCLSSLMPLMTGAVAQHYVVGVEEPSRHAALGTISRASVTTTTQLSMVLKRRQPARPEPAPALAVEPPRPRSTALPPDQRALSLVDLPQVPERAAVAAAIAPAPALAREPAAAPAPLPAPTALVAAVAEPNAVVAEPTPGAVVDVKSILRALSGSRRSNSLTDAQVQSIPKDGPLRLEALHLGESLEVQPFDAQLQPNAGAMAKIAHAMRCRVTGTEIAIHPRLVELLVQLHTLYGKPIELVSGHRQPHTIGTKKTSQHTLGRAADIRISGVSIDALKRAALKLGARGIGLYPEKGFVHVDVRDKSRYTWVYTAAGGEVGDNGVRRGPKPAAEVEGAAPPAPSSDEDSEPSEDAHPHAHADESAHEEAPAHAHDESGHEDAPQ